jgi:hypothetical protein
MAMQALLSGVAIKKHFYRGGKKSQSNRRYFCSENQGLPEKRAGVFTMNRDLILGIVA